MSGIRDFEIISIRKLIRINDNINLEIISEHRPEIQFYLRKTYFNNNQCVLYIDEQRTTNLSDNVWRFESRKTDSQGRITYESCLLNNNN